MDPCLRRHAVVTGSASGIGRATALRLAADGYHVFAGVRREADGTALGADAAGAGILTPVILDVTDAGQITAAVQAVRGHLAGRGLDGLVDNAGVGVSWPMELIPLDMLRRRSRSTWWARSLLPRDSCRSSGRRPAGSSCWDRSATGSPSPSAAH